MKKRFNDTGVCIPGRHYMVDTADKISQIFKMVEQGDYFVINRPRQYGKTTTLFLLNRKLKQTDGYFPIKISFEGIGSDSYKSETAFIQALLLKLKRIFELSNKNELVQLIHSAHDLTTINKLDEWFSQLVTKVNQQVVLMIDEVDKSSNNQLFLDFLGILREKYLKSREGEDITFHSVILAGVHDVKSLKSKLRADSQSTYNSPWNIAANFTVDLSLAPEEIASMLTEYSAESKTTVDVPFFSRQLFWLTSGYPFLVSYLCKAIEEEILPGKKKPEWKPDDLSAALKITLSKNNTNFESLVKNLENNRELYDLVFQVIMNGKEFSYNPRNPVIHLGTTYGILKEEGSKARIHNRLYEQLIYDYMSSKLETSGAMNSTGVSTIADSYIGEDGSLNIEKVIKKFQEFMKEQYSRKDISFIERNGRLLFLAFIKPIINGKGFDFKEVQISEEKRLDVVITFENRKYIVELKIWRGESYHQEGIKQLCAYLEQQNQEVGYLLIYDLRKEKGKAGDYETTQLKGKSIIMAWV
ncbi:MAG: AAA family ATPase [bacterium]|nr:AAA family ATPase [bacterium]